MSGTLAVQTATPIWHRMMQHLKNDYAARPLVGPGPGSKLVSAEICPLSGLLPIGSGQAEWFLAGTVPTETAGKWFAAGSRQALLPDAYAKWVDSKHNHLGAKLQPPADGSGLLKILSPSDGLTYVIDRDLPAAQQELELRALTEAESVEWSVNGQPHADPHWRLRPGQWQITARTPTGAEAKVSFAVE